MNTSHARKKVLFLITKSNWGGAQRYIYDLATNLDPRQFEPVVAMGGNGILAEMLGNAGVRTITLKEMKNTSSFGQMKQAASELRHMLNQERPDVLHLNSSIAGLVGALVGRTARIPTILFTAHGWAFNEDRPWLERGIIKFLHWLTVLLSDRTIAVSRAIVTQMDWPFVHHKMKVINPGRTIGVTYDRTDARAAIVNFCPALALYQNDCWIVCIGELHPIKRHLVLIQAFQALPSSLTATTRLIFIGEGTTRSAIETYITEHALGEHVILTGNVTEAARFLKAFDLFVLASKSESYGYVLHEAGLVGVPIVTTNVGGIPDIITNQKTGRLVPPDNVPPLTEAMHASLIKTDETTYFASTLQAELTKRTVVKMARQTESLY